MRPGSIAVMLGMALGLWTLLHLYTGLRLIRDSGLRGRAARAAWSFFAASWLFPPVFLLFARGTSPAEGAGWIAAWIAYSFVGLMGMLFPYVLARDVLWLAGTVVRLVPRDPVRARAAYNASSALVAILAAGGAIAAAVIGALPPRVVRVDLPVRDLPAQLEGFTIAFYSDLHLGAIGRRSLSEDIAAQVDALHPDVAVLGGDLGDGRAADLAAAAAPLGRITARRFFVTGNHDYFRDLAGWLAEVKRLGYETLTNEHRVVRRGTARVLIGGIPDYNVSTWFGTPSDPAAARKGAPRCDVAILLSHNPVSAPEAAGCGWDFQLSGHTHGGQFFPWTVLFGKLPWYWPGFHRAGRMLVYVSPGAGSWGPPFRLGARTEINVFRLVRARPGRSAPVHAVGREDFGQASARGAPGLVAQVAGVREHGARRRTQPSRELGRTTG